MNKWKFAGITLILLLLGFLRMFWFEHFNLYLYQTYYRQTRMDESLFTPFKYLPYSVLYYLKYLFTVLFIVAFYLLTRWGFRVLNQKPLLPILNFSYAGLLLLAGLLTLAQYGLGLSSTGPLYLINLWLMGIAESPLPFLFLISIRNLNLYVDKD